MAAEAKRIQISANFEAEVHAAVRQQRSADSQAEEAVDPGYLSDIDPDDRKTSSTSFPAAPTRTRFQRSPATSAR